MYWGDFLKVASVSKGESLNWFSVVVNFADSTDRAVLISTLRFRYDHPTDLALALADGKGPSLLSRWPLGELSVARWGLADDFLPSRYFCQASAQKPVSTVENDDDDVSFTSEEPPILTTTHAPFSTSNGNELCGQFYRTCPLKPSACKLRLPDDSLHVGACPKVQPAVLHRASDFSSELCFPNTTGDNFILLLRW